MVRKNTSKESEKVTEKYLKYSVEKLGGACIKQNAGDGVPDRLVILPGPWIAFVETKSEGDVPKPHQMVYAMKLKNLGAKVFLIDTKEKVDRLLQLYLKTR